MREPDLRVAVVGATGLVGRTLLRVLSERGLPVRELVPLASERSREKTVDFGGRPLPVEVLNPGSFAAGFDLVFFSAGAEVSREYASPAAELSRLVVDNSSAFRLTDGIPLVVPEVNGGLLEGYRGIVANPNCSTIQLAVALQPLHRHFGLESVIVSTYQSVSGTGAKGVNSLCRELETGTHDPESPYPHSIANNVLPHIDVFEEGGWTKEERKMIFETRKILSLSELHIVPTTVRVPVRVGHSEAVYARFRQPIDPVNAREVLSRAPGVVVRDCPESFDYPTPLNVDGRDEVFVGRIRQLPGDTHGLSLWIVADNLRKGAATNAVQIAEKSFQA